MQKLFSDNSLPDTLREFLQSIQSKVDKIPREQFLVSADQDIIDHIYSRMAIEPLALHLENQQLIQEEIQIDVSHVSGRNPFGDPGPIYVPGFRQKVFIPFTGDLPLLRSRPSKFVLSFPHGIIHAAEGSVSQIEIVVDAPADTGAEKIREQIDREKSLLNQFIGFQEGEIKEFNEMLKVEIGRSIDARRQRLQKQEGIATALNIPLKPREGAPDFKPIQIQKKLVQPLPPPPQKGYKPEPGISQEIYEDILGIIRHVARTFETTPATFNKFEEEELRDIFLANLNSHYPGDASGETFRKSGKTDIRIEAGDRAAFIAECKVWKGIEELTDGINQLHGYLTWRDGKCSMIVLNKHNARFSDLLEKVPSAFVEHANFIRATDRRSDGEWRFIFNTHDDEGRRIQLHVFLINLYVKNT